METYSAVADIFSGRPNPAWILEKNDVKTLNTIWDTLTVCAPPEPPPPALGYRGVTVRHGNTDIFFTFKGYVSQKHISNTEWRADTNHLFEQFLISTAPNGLIPDSL